MLYTEIETSDHFVNEVDEREDLPRPASPRAQLRPHPPSRAPNNRVINSRAAV